MMAVSSGNRIHLSLSSTTLTIDQSKGHAIATGMKMKSGAIIAETIWLEM
jgi:hypothetical protein